MKSHAMLSSLGYLILVLLATCLSPGAACGQDSKARLSDGDNLKSLTPGQAIRVVTKDVEYYQGEFESLRDDGITLRQKAREQTLARNDILRVSLKSGKSHAVRNTIIGAAIGAGVGLGMGVLANNRVWYDANCTEGADFSCAGPPYPHWEIMLTAAGALAGTAIGAGISTRGWHDVYRVGK
jgi:hypothetical protein